MAGLFTTFRARICRMATKKSNTRWAAKILLKLINSVPPMQQEAVLAAELERMLGTAVDSVMNNLANNYAKRGIGYFDLEPTPARKVLKVSKALREAYDKAHPHA